ncbi:MAG: T9SS type A sorting domain-containing protein [Chitinophagales bacterium]|jgi:hypothetical protein|nr:T9SS type A sorting domain-containing protein [Chitinophagales bacterium]
MKKNLHLFCCILLLTSSYSLLLAQEYDFKTTTYYYRTSTDSLVSSGLSLASFNFSFASRTNDSLFTDGIYFPAVDCFGRNLWVRVRHIAEDPNGTNVGINIPSTASSPCPSTNYMLGGWAGFLYDFEIHQDTALTGTRSNYLGALFPTSITVASLETLSGSCAGAEWLSFMIVNSGSTGWSLNSINFTGNNPNSNPGFSDTMAVYTTGGCTPPDGFSYTFPTGADSISFISASCCGFSEFKMSSANVSHFQYGYEYAGGAGGYQGMTMAFGTPPTFTAANAQNVTCKNGTDGAISVIITGGAGPFTYEWSGTNASGNSLTNLPAGTYNLTVVDQNGCGTIAPSTFTITEPANVSVNVYSILTTQVSCFGANDGSVSLFASGVDSISYQWSNNSNTDSIQTALAPGIYFATITDNGSCIVVTDTISQPDAIDTAATQSGNTIIVSETAATYQWLNCDNNTIVTDSTAASITPSITGNYKAIITKNGCVDSTACFSVTVISGVEETIFASSVSVIPNPTTGNITINYSKVFSETEILVADISGRIVYRKNETGKQFVQLNLQQLAGVYFITIKTETTSVVKKLVISNQ